MIEPKYWNDKYDPTESKFNKILIANRNDIACRVIKTCKRMGIKTVAAHSRIDAENKFVHLADESFCLNNTDEPYNDSYLDMNAILNAMKQTGSQAVHPGWGFLAENAEFPKFLAERGVTFIGPSSKAMKLLGDKLESKRLARKVGCNVIPGFDGKISNLEHAIEVSNDIGYPVQIKASAGGGGRGVRTAYSDEDIRNVFDAAKEETRRSFGDDTMLIEKYILNSRHIEVQILCDKHGNAIHLNERECSVQRRHQKIIEEAPSVIVSPEMRNELGIQAINLCKAAGYDSVGTVEFLVDSDRNLYFLEMNTRLQVEHMVTEATTGIDIVQQMIRISKGHPLVHKQNDVPQDGWSIQCRVYSEDPTKGDFGERSTGTILEYTEPNLSHVWIDSGIWQGSKITKNYDCMISKVIATGKTRDEAIVMMKKALECYHISGVTHNIALLYDIICDTKFKSGNITTKYLYEQYPKGFIDKAVAVPQNNDK